MAEAPAYARAGSKVNDCRGSAVVQFESLQELSFRSAALSREESAVCLPAASRFLAGRTGCGMTRGSFLRNLHRVVNYGMRLPASICHPERLSNRACAAKASRGSPTWPRTHQVMGVPLGSALGRPRTMTTELCRSQQLVPHVLQHVQSALDSHLARKNGIFILNTENALVADFHVGEHDLFPGAGTVPVAHGAEGL
jgi:hypothetical protein